MNGLLNKGERKQIVLYVIKSGIVLLFCAYWMIGIKGEWSYYCVANESKDLFGDCMVWLFDFIYSGIVLGIIGYSIFKMDSIVKHVNYNKWYIPASYSFLGTCGVGFINNPMNERINKVASFTREIGISAFYDVDVSKRVNHFYVWLLFITVSFVILYCFACYVRDDSEKNGLLQNRRFINRFIVVADAVMLIESSNFFSDRTDGFIQFHISVYFIKLLAVCFFIFFVTNNYCKMKLEYYYYALICSLPISLSIGCLMGLDLNEGKTVFGFMIIIAGSVIAFCMFKGKTHISKAILVRGGIWIASLPLFSSLYTECLAICNRNEIFIRWPIIVYIIGIIILGLLVLGLSALQMNMLEWQKSKTLIYSLLILGVTSLSAQAQIVGKYDPHIYEGANYGVLISDFLNYGRVPIVEHYGGHMMTGVWEGLLYGWLNNDFLEAYVSPYSQYVNIVIVFIFWLMIRELIDEDIAFLITLVLPFFSMFEYYGMGVMCCLFLKQYIRKNNYRNAFGLALSCVWTGLYRLDMGVAFVLAIISVLIIWCIIKKEGARLVKVLISGTVVGLIVAGIWMGVCYSKAINVVDSIQDFVAISSSNNTWAYATIGDSTFIGYSWYYYILPLAVMIGLCVVLKGCIHTKSEDLSIDMMILAIGFSFVFNYSRGLVRHSLYESATKVIVWSGYIFLVLVLIRFYKNCTATFVVALMSFIIIEQALSGGRNLEYSSIMDTASSNAEKAIECWSSDVEGNSTSFFEFMNQNEMVIDRVDLSEELQQYKDDYSAVIGDLLTKEETFVDFTNNSILYPLLGKEDPAYISQTPMQLSGEYAQMRFIKDMNRAPIVLLPIQTDEMQAESALDEIPNSYRNYLVAEHIYRNYQPLCMLKERCAIWCLQSKYDEYLEKINQSVYMNTGKVERIDYGYDGPRIVEDDNGDYSIVYDDYLHIYDIGDLPLVWGEKDIKNASQNDAICEANFADGFLFFDTDKINDESQSCYIMLIAECECDKLSDNEGLLRLGNLYGGEFDEKNRYIFNLKDGEHVYLFRVSADYYWNQKLLNGILLQGEEIKSVRMYLIEGD